MEPCHLLCGLPSYWGCFSVLLLLCCVSIVITREAEGRAGDNCALAPLQSKIESLAYARQALYL